VFWQQHGKLGLLSPAPVAAIALLRMHALLLVLPSGRCLLLLQLPAHLLAVLATVNSEPGMTS
jgi:hypothetical protein